MGRTSCATRNVSVASLALLPRPDTGDHREGVLHFKDSRPSEKTRSNSASSRERFRLCEGGKTNYGSWHPSDVQDYRSTLQAPKTATGLYRPDELSTVLLTPGLRPPLSVLALVAG